MKDGGACPVCGSVNHPKLAKMVDNVLTKEELDKEKELLDVCYQELEQLRIDIVNKEKDLEVINGKVNLNDEENLIIKLNELNILCKEIAVNDDLDYQEVLINVRKLEHSISEKEKELGSTDTNDLLNLKIKKLNKKIDEISLDVDNIKKSYDFVYKQKVDIESFITVCNEDILNLNKQLINVKEEYKTSYKELGYENENTYLKLKIDKSELFILEKEVKDYREELSDLKSKISALENVVKDKKFVNIEDLEIKLKKYNLGIDEINLSLKNINSKLSNNKKIYDKLVGVYEKTINLEKEVMIYKDLSDTANGTITGKNKLEFEQYVQASYFDRVLLSANKRLKFMTDDRYQLLRKEEASKVSDKLGLELEIMDYYTGKKRDIKSLSGGESFKASLSLALGMSDTIQEYSGGVVVEAMFIDEGFGSLDDESLENAMNAIMMLSQNNKIIGIISHVNELKSRIDKKIVVKKSSNGSTVSMVV